MIELEIQFFNEHLKEWLKREAGKIVLVKDQQVIGFFNTPEDALSEAARRFGLTSYLVRTVSEKQQEESIPAMTLGVFHADPTYATDR